MNRKLDSAHLKPTTEQASGIVGCRENGRFGLVPSWRVWQILILLTLGFSACQSVEMIGYWNRTDTETQDTVPQSTDDTQSEDSGDTGTGTSGDGSDSHSDSTDDPVSTETETETEMSSDSDTTTETSPTLTRVPFLVTDQADPMTRVLKESNLLGLSGSWYPYNDMFGTRNERYFDGAGNICIRGEVAQWSGNFNEWTNAGVGVSLCYDPGANFNFFPVGECPYSPFNFEFEGVSFQISGQMDNELRIHIVEPYITVSGSALVQNDGIQDYLFSESFDMIPDASITPSNIVTIRFQVDNAPGRTVRYDFCITDFALLVSGI